VIEAEAQYREWMLAGLAGDAGAYRKLLAGLTGHLRAYFARRVGPGAAEDLVQETLIARGKRHATVPLDEAPALFAADDAEPAAAKRDVEKLLAKLPAPKRALVRAIKLEGDTVADTAAASGLSESAVKVTVHRAIKSLNEDVTRDED
jgi:RNA polymerase sigma-70 factor (ECF subfamily)